MVSVIVSVKISGYHELVIVKSLFKFAWLAFILVNTTCLDV